MTTSAVFIEAQPFTQQSSRLYHPLASTRMQYGKPGPSDSAGVVADSEVIQLGIVRIRAGNSASGYFPHLLFTRVRPALTQELHSPWLGCISSLIGSYLTHERPTRPISKAEASGWETGSTFCSRGPDRQLAYRPSGGDSLRTEVES